MIADTVLRFDRDYTVDVNPHPDHDAVPLAWVKAWAHAHEYEHIDVWATGNQHLTTEARIPGTQHARICWERLEGRDLTARDDSSSYEGYKPARIEGLRLIRDCYEHPSVGLSYEEIPQFIVIDDIDLFSLSSEGWEWWLPWEFTESVQQRGKPLSPPNHARYPSVPADSTEDDNQYTISASVLK